MEANRNVIPRKTTNITGRLLVGCGGSVGDVIHVFRDEYDRWIHLNTTTNKTYLGNFDIYRSKEMFEVLSVIK